MHVYKMIGYGLTDLRTADDAGDWLDDPRINRDSRLLEPGRTDADDYLQHLANHEDVDLQLEHLLLQNLAQGDRHPSAAVDCSHEYGLRNVLCVRPVSSRNWARYDDPIDYEESRLVAGGFEATARLLPGGIYPTNGLWMDTRTGQRCPHGFIWWVRARNSEHIARLTRIDLDHLAQAGGFTDHNDALMHAAPLLPDVIRDLVTWGELFTDPAHALQLRPMVYTRLG